MKKNRWSSLQVKIIAWSFVPAAIILSAVAWFTFYSYQKVLGDLAIKQDRAAVQTKAVQFGSALGGLLDPILLPIVMDIDIHPEKPVEARAQAILEQAKSLEVFDGGIYFLDRQGKIFKTQPEQQNMIGQDWSGTPQFRYLAAHRNTAPFSDLLSVPGGKEILCMGWSMSDPQGEFAGGTYFCFTISPVAENAYFQTLDRLDLGTGAYIVDGNRRVIYSPDPGQVGMDLSQEPYLQQLLQGPGTSGWFRKGTGDIVVSYYPVNGEVADQMRWVFVKEQSLAQIMQPSLAYRKLLLALLALGGIVPALVTAYGVRHITHPIQKLIQAAGQVTAGRFSQRIEVKTGDEIETLAVQFNEMSAKLDEFYASLEKKVADRTRELAVMNSILAVASHSFNVQEVLEESLNETVEQMGFDGGAAYRLERDPNSPILAVQRGIDPPAAIDLARRFELKSRGDSAGSPPQVVVEEIEGSNGSEEADESAPPGPRLLAFVPLSTKGRSLGGFLLTRKSPGGLSPEELSLLGSIGKQVGVAIENARLFEQAEQAATAAERNRLARELHDAVTQTLFSTNLIADVLPRIWQRDPEEGLRNLEELRQLTRGALAEMRTLLLEMRPESLERADLKSLLVQLTDAFIGRVRVPVALVIQGEPEPAQEIKLVFYRVAQEALNNIAKHSGARQVQVCLECAPGLMRLLIKDDGLGFDPGAVTPDHLGIAIMRERANAIQASLLVASQAGQGTTIELEWPAKRMG